MIKALSAVSVLALACSMFLATLGGGGLFA